jgi:hypothetical protein
VTTRHPQLPRRSREGVAAPDSRISRRRKRREDAGHGRTACHRVAGCYCCGRSSHTPLQLLAGDGASPEAGARPAQSRGGTRRAGRRRARRGEGLHLTIGPELNRIAGRERALHLCLLLPSGTGAGTSSPSPPNRGAFRREERVRHPPPLAGLGDKDRPCSIRRPWDGSICAATSMGRSAGAPRR